MVKYNFLFKEKSKEMKWKLIPSENIGCSAEAVWLLSICFDQTAPGPEVYPAFSLVELRHCCALIGPELQSGEIFSFSGSGTPSVATPAVYAMKNQLVASKAPY